MRVIRLMILMLFVGQFASVRFACAADTVFYRTGSDRVVRSAIGTVVDYTGRNGAVIDTSAGRRAIPARYIQRIETRRLDQQLEADQLFDQRAYRDALALYRAARTAENRGWVRRELTARIVECCVALGDTEAACSEFAVLAQSDPESWLCSCIPLTWTPVGLGATRANVMGNADTHLNTDSDPLHQLSTQWLAESDQPSIRLMAASRLLGTSRNDVALRWLSAIAWLPDSGEPDESGAGLPVAQLAAMQVWRTRLTSATRSKVDAWRDVVRRLPEPLQAGPYYLLGDAYQHLGDDQAAVLAWMRVPVLYPHDQQLAASALLHSANALTEMGRKRQAVRLYKEVTREYTATPSAQEAELRLQENAQL